ncbi:hypothetical protein GCM10009744_52110 [Kribbella alba]|uniref:Uncharacterized protein n=1 Tax=Kribbella alba TaxID=190197 RepID=A0ABN2FNN3_9ACTN
MTDATPYAQAAASAQTNPHHMSPTLSWQASHGRGPSIAEKSVTQATELSLGGSPGRKYGNRNLTLGQRRPLVSHFSNS